MPYPLVVGCESVISWEMADCTVIKNGGGTQNVQFSVSEPYRTISLAPNDAEVSTQFVLEYSQTHTGDSPSDPWTYAMFFTNTVEGATTWTTWLLNYTYDYRFQSDIWFEGVDDESTEFTFSKLHFRAPPHFPSGMDHTHISYPTAENRYGLSLFVARKLETSNNVAHHFTPDPFGYNWDFWEVYTPLFDIALVYGGEHPLSGPLASNKIFGGLAI